MIRRIHVVYHLAADPKHAETIERVHQVHARYCPVYRSIEKSIEVTTECRLIQPE